MSYWVKKCAQCGAVHHPNDAVCRDCLEELPVQKVQIDTPPPPPNRLGPAPTPVRAIPATSPLRANNEPLSVVVTSLDIPFLQLIWLMAKVIMASLPALLVAVVVVFLLIVSLVKTFGVLSF